MCEEQNSIPFQVCRLLFFTVTFSKTVIHGYFQVANGITSNFAGLCLQGDRLFWTEQLSPLHGRFFGNYFTLNLNKVTTVNLWTNVLTQ